jgi:hypothetical protein
MSTNTLPKIKILFLGANPSNTTRLALGDEVREIMQDLRGIGFSGVDWGRAHVAAIGIFCSREPPQRSMLTERARRLIGRMARREQVHPVQQACGAKTSICASPTMPCSSPPNLEQIGMVHSRESRTMPVCASHRLATRGLGR